LFHKYKRTRILELQSLEDWSWHWTHLCYNKVLHAHKFYTLLSLQNNKELCSLPDFIL